MLLVTVERLFSHTHQRSKVEQHAPCIINDGVTLLFAAPHLFEHFQPIGGMLRFGLPAPTIARRIVVFANLLDDGVDLATERNNARHKTAHDALPDDGIFSGSLVLRLTPANGRPDQSGRVASS